MPEDISSVENLACPLELVLTTSFTTTLPFELVIVPPSGRVTTTFVWLSVPSFTLRIGSGTLSFLAVLSFLPVQRGHIPHMY